MSKIFLRIAVYLLIPCLIADPVTASAFYLPFSKPDVGFAQSRFNDQALADRVLAFEHHPILVVRRVSWGIMASVFLAASTAFGQTVSPSVGRFEPVSPESAFWTPTILWGMVCIVGLAFAGLMATYFSFRRMEITDGKLAVKISGEKDRERIEDYQSILDLPLIHEHVRRSFPRTLKGSLPIGKNYPSRTDSNTTDPLVTEPRGTIFKKAREYHLSQPGQDKLPLTHAVIQFQIHLLGSDQMRADYLFLVDLNEWIPSLTAAPNGPIDIPHVVFDQTGHGTIYIPRPRVDWTLFSRKQWPILLDRYVTLLASPKDAKDHELQISRWNDLLSPYFIIAPVLGFERQTNHVVAIRRVVLPFSAGRKTQRSGASPDSDPSSLSDPGKRHYPGMHGAGRDEAQGSFFDSLSGPVRSGRRHRLRTTRGPLLSAA